MRRICGLIVLCLLSIAEVHGQDNCTPQLAYMWEDDNNYGEILISELDGSNIRNLTNTPFIEEKSPRWSPDGSQIAYVDSYSVYVMNADGSNPTVLYEGVAPDNTEWSPDGNYIAFTSTDSTLPGRSVFIIRPDGKDLEKITLDADVQTGRISWTQDSQYFTVSASAENEKPDIYIITITDGTINRLQPPEIFRGASSWTANNHLTFYEDGSLYIVDPFVDGATPEELFPVGALFPVIWSSDDSVEEAIFLDGTDVWRYQDGERINLTQDDEDILDLDWSQEAGYAAYTAISFTENFVKLKLINLETGEITSLHENAYESDFRPC